MSLTFEYVKNLNTGAQPFIAHEADSSIYNYFVDGEQAKDRHTSEVFGLYDNISFTNEDSSITTHAVNTIGVKNFPGIGAIGFYTDSYLDEAHIVAPIHNHPKKYDAPVLKKAELVGGKLHIVIEPSTDINYKCYRIIAQQGNFAFEYISYKEDYLFSAPSVKGTYSVYCIGYDEDYSSVSQESNRLSLTIETGADDWSPADTDDLARRVNVIEADIVNYDYDTIHNGIIDILSGGDT